MANRIALKPGDVLGRFQLLVPIGAGGMGRVWVAREQGLVARPRLVAIKTALAEEAASEDYWKVLLDEARIASQIQHPNVCSIHALDRERGVVYLVMDWSDGGSLRELLDALPDHRLSPHLGARLVAHVCAGLHAAHELVDADSAPLNVVHRDVSPQNVLISANGQVKITDFGVAKARGQIHAPTQTGEVKGKLSYMAPEQVTTRDVDRRADVFALGCVLYECTAGSRPFHGDDALATLYQLLEQPIQPPSAVVASYPSGLERIVLKALERNADARYQTTEDMGRALQSWLASEGAMVADSDISAIVQTALGDRVAARIQAVQEAIIALDQPEPEPEPEVEVEIIRTGVETLSGAAASTVPRIVLARPRRMFWATLAGAAVALSVVAAVARRNFPPPVSPPSPKVSPALVAPKSAEVEKAQPAQRVQIRLRAEPPQAALTLDDGSPVSNPHELTVTPDSRPHVIKATLAGFEEREQEVAFDRDREVILNLRPLSKARRPGAASAASVKTQPVSSSAPAEVPSAHSPKLGDLPSVVKRPPRLLDSDNPFAQKP